MAAENDDNKVIEETGLLSSKSSETTKGAEIIPLRESLLDLCFELERHAGHAGHLATIEHDLGAVREFLLQDVAEQTPGSITDTKDLAHCAHELVSTRQKSNAELPSEADIKLPGLDRLSLLFHFQTHKKGDPMPSIMVSIKCDDGLDDRIEARANEVAQVMKDRPYYYDHRDLSENL